MHIDYPFHLDSRGRTATTSEDDHVRDLIEQVLFTAPGERVNRPSFGSGVLGLVFAGQSDALISTTQLTVQGSLQQWLGEIISVEGVLVEQEESTLRVTVQYVIQRSQRRQVATLTREI